MKRRVTIIILWVLALSAISLCIGGCGTVTPRFVEAKGVAYGDDGLQDAGVKGVVIERSTGAKLILKQASDRALYNLLAAHYANRFIPPLKPDDGILPHNSLYAFRNATLVNFVTLKVYARADGLVVP